MKDHIFFCTLTCLIFLTSACGKEEPAQTETTATAGEPAIEALTARIEQNPQDPSLYAARAELYYENEAFDEAIQDLSQALKIDSTNVDYHHLLADVYLDYFKSRLALQTMERAAALYPERIPTLLKLSEFQLILKQNQASLKTIDHILRLDPRNPEAYFMFGMNFKEMGDTARAINSFQEAVEIDPDLVDGWINLGQLHAAINGSLAGQFFDNAIEVDTTNVTAYSAKADYLWGREDRRGALELYRTAARIDPQYEEAHYNAGLVLMELDSVEQAYQEFDITLNVDPLHVQAYFFRGYAAEQLGRAGQARSDYEHALRLAPDYELPRQGLERLASVETQE